MMNREQQIEFITNAEERAQGYVSGWLKDPEYIAALYRLRRRREEPVRVRLAHG